MGSSGPEDYFSIQEHAWGMTLLSGNIAGMFYENIHHSFCIKFCLETEEGSAWLMPITIQ